LHEGRTFSLRVEPIDLDATLGCGQAFRWRRGSDGSWTGVVGRNILRLGEDRRGLVVQALAWNEGVERELATYIRADDDIGAIQSALSKDTVLSRGMSELKGLRLVKMDEWECLISYVLATYANIPRIKAMVESIAATFGDEILDGVHGFPTINDLRGASRRDLDRCGLGYRAGYVRAICEALDPDGLDRMRRLEYAELRDELKSLPGVGDKVADCVSLFGFGRLEAFPIDVWMKRALSRLYGISGSYARLREFASLRFGGFAGYAQEYLFYNERSLASADGCAFSEER
jgi:N-glycosylase/DNA lyase